MSASQNNTAETKSVENNIKVGQRYQYCFKELTAKNEGAFIPFVTIGDPDAEQSFEVIKTLIDAGADALELGIPFSDPSADGITIQKATLRALNSGINTDICIDILAKVRAYAPHIPIGLLLYGNLVFARGINNFYRDMAAVGVDSVLIADLPIRESQPFREAALSNGIAPIFIAPPNASEATLLKVAQYSQGYTYVLSRAGVTGVDVEETANKVVDLSETNTSTEQSNTLDNLLNALKENNAAPAVLGFGISSPAQVKAALASGAAGAISGSAVVKIIENNSLDSGKYNQESKTTMLKELSSFISEMKQATVR
jgi:tryptophan synthase alpha chain